MVRARSKMGYSKLILFIMFIFMVTYNKKIYASDTRINSGLQIMEYIFSKYEDMSFLVKYRKDKKFIGVLIIHPKERRANVLKVFDTTSGEVAFEYEQNDREITDFIFKKNAVILIYKSTFWQEKVAYDLTSGKFVRRYSSWLAEGEPKIVEKKLEVNK